MVDDIRKSYSGIAWSKEEESLKVGSGMEGRELEASLKIECCFESWADDPFSYLTPEGTPVRVLSATNAQQPLNQLHSSLVSLFRCRTTVSCSEHHRESSHAFKGKKIMADRGRIFGCDLPELCLRAGRQNLVRNFQPINRPLSFVALFFDDEF